MALNPFYEDELSYLRELGREFALANPKLAGFLGREANDPDVERLLEGFAFLVARLRQKLDDEFPEFVHGLLRMVWPQYLQPIPPITTLAFSAVGAASGGIISIPAGTSVRSRPLDGTSCTFVTSYPIDVLPLTVGTIQLENRSSSARLSVQFKRTDLQAAVALPNGRMRLFLETEREPQVGRALLAWLCRHLTQATVTSSGRTLAKLDAADVKPYGFADNEAVLPWPGNAFSGFRIVQEYLTYPAKFLYVELAGLEALAQLQDDAFVLTFEFSRPLPDRIRVGDGAIRVNCTPAINRFGHEAMPVRIERAKTEYRVLPSGGPSFSIHSVDRAVGYMQGRPDRLEFGPFDALRHDLPGADNDRMFFRARIRPAVIGRGIDHYVSFVDRLERHQRPSIEVASLNLTCSNGPIADRLPVGSVDQATSDTPPSVSFTNITPVTSEIPPPVSDGLLRRLVANLARNYGSLTDVETLRTVIATYDFRAVYDSQARRRLELLLEGLERFVATDGDTVVSGVPMRMRRIELQLSDSKIGGEGELFLLGAVLDAFLASYAGINMLHRFSVRGIETNVVYTWPSRAGTNRSF